MWPVQLGAPLQPLQPARPVEGGNGIGKRLDDSGKPKVLWADRLASAAAAAAAAARCSDDDIVEYARTVCERGDGSIRDR